MMSNIGAFQVPFQCLPCPQKTDACGYLAAADLPADLRIAHAFVISHPEEMGNVVDKIRASGNEKVLLTERGTFFGYKRLVNDMTCIEVMKRLGCPVVFDATHSTQQPGGLGDASAGDRQLAPILAKAAVQGCTEIVDRRAVDSRALPASQAIESGYWEGY